jgi:hypothetical protein
MQGNRITPEKIAAMREFRKDHTRKETVEKFSVSVTTVARYCKDVKSTAKVEINKKFNSIFQPNSIGECKNLKFSELSQEDQAKYNNCKPAVKEKTRTYAGW